MSKLNLTKPFISNDFANLMYSVFGYSKKELIDIKKETYMRALVGYGIDAKKNPKAAIELRNLVYSSESDMDLMNACFKNFDSTPIGQLFINK